MKRAGRLAVFVVATVSAVAAGYGLHTWNNATRPVSGGAEHLMAAALPDMEGNSQALAQWRGKVMVVNFWATWCSPCLKEIPEFVRMQEKLGPRGLQFVGIAIDNRDKVREFAAKFRINYPMLIGDMEGIELVRLVGNDRGGLPFTVILDRQGRMIGTELGGLNEKKLTAIVAPALSTSP